jgi:putative membrane protein
MMHGWDGGVGAGGWFVMSFLWVALLVVIVWALLQLFPRRDERSTTEKPAPAGERPEEILDRRLALGEIDVETHEKLRQALRAGTR